MGTLATAPRLDCVRYRGTGSTLRAHCHPSGPEVEATAAHALDSSSSTGYRSADWWSSGERCGVRCVGGASVGGGQTVRAATVPSPRSS